MKRNIQIGLMRLLLAIIIISLTSSVFSQSSKLSYLYSMNNDTYIELTKTKQKLRVNDNTFKTVYSVKNKDNQVIYSVTAINYKDRNKVEVEVENPSDGLFSSIRTEKTSYDIVDNKPFGFRGTVAKLGGPNVPNQLKVQFEDENYINVIHISCNRFQTSEYLYLVIDEQHKRVIESRKIDKKNKLENGVYEYRYDLDDSSENHYIEVKDGKMTYYGTSDDFDDAREGYYVGYFFTETKTPIIEKGEIIIRLDVNESNFYTDQVTPMIKLTEENAHWDTSIRYLSRVYIGQIKDGNIILKTEDFDERLFVKIR